MNLELEFGNVLLNSLPLLLFCLLDSFVSLKNSPKIPYQLPFDLSTGVVKFVTYGVLVCNFILHLVSFRWAGDDAMSF